VDTAEQAITAIEKEISKCQIAWVASWGNYWIADILWLLHRKPAASASAVAAGAEANEPPTLALTGTFARWSAVLACRTGRAATQLNVLRNLRMNSERLDALDRAELCCSILQLSKESGNNQVEHDVLNEARSALRSLPASCSELLEALGLVLPDR
jgi:hypothetical protein